MALSTDCKDDLHDACNGNVVEGAPGPLQIGTCKCKCHKGKANKE